MLRVWVYFLAAISLLTEPALSQSPVLTQAAQVLDLSIVESQKALPVQLRGVVISGREMEAGTAVIRDLSGAVYIRTTGLAPGMLSRANEVEVSGVTSAGEFAPTVVAKEVRVLGQGTIPPPKRVTYEELHSGRLDSQWLEVSGRLRSCSYLSGAIPFVPGAAATALGGTEAEIASGGGRLVVGNLGRGIDPEWVDGIVRVRGICFHQFNQKRQPYKMYLLVPEGETVVLEQPPAARPFELPVRSIGSLMQFAESGSFGQRVRVRGVVTLQHPGEFLYIHGEDRGLCVRTVQETRVAPGDEVDVAGFPSQGDYSPILEDAVFRVVSHDHPQPIPIPVQRQRDAYERDTELISVKGKLIGFIEQSNGWVFSMEMDGSVFTSFLLRPAGSRTTPKLELGSELATTGVCAVVMGSTVPRDPLRVPQSFRVLLRSDADLIILKLPPWWTPQRTFFVCLTVVVLLVVCISLVVSAARTRLRQQEIERRQAEAEFAAIFRERNRVAREIHDTLAQDIAAISVHLEVVRNQSASLSPAALSHLSMAQTGARQSLQEARRTIWNMRSQVLEGRDLAVALSELLEQETGGSGVKPKVVVNGKVRRLPSAIENDLLRIGQEAIHNAVRHAKAGSLTLELTFAEDRLRLLVKDDGRGFDVQQSKNVRATQFGLKGMRERARLHGGELVVRSCRGQGTEIMVEVPLV